VIGKSILALFLILGVLGGCSSNPPSNRTALLPYLTGASLPKMDSVEMRSFLTQTVYMAGGQYEVQATPLTLPLIEQEARELQRERGLSDEELKRVVDYNRFNYYDDRFCADIQMSIVRFGQVADLDQWKFQLVDSLGEKYQMKWVDQDAVHGPVVTYFSGLYGPEKKWYNRGRICTNIAIDRALGFKIEANPSFVQWPFPNTALLYWGIDVPDSYQSYRRY